MTTLDGVAVPSIEGHRCQAPSVHHMFLRMLLPPRRRVTRAVALLSMLALLPQVSVAAPAPTDTWLWAWDRSEDLRWLAPGTGVAYFAVQFDARGDTFTATWRRPVLQVRPDTRLLPVLHIEAFGTRRPPVLDGRAVALWSGQLAEAIERLAVPRVQIDFEARAGQRDFYRDVLAALRARLPADVRLSITALASWCGEPAWLSSLPVDEVVPMYFRMGPAERGLWRRRLAEPGALPPACRAAVGVSVDEWPALVAEVGMARLAGLGDRPWYVFSPQAWRPTLLAAWQLSFDGAAPSSHRHPARQETPSPE